MKMFMEFNYGGNQDINNHLGLKQMKSSVG